MGFSIGGRRYPVKAFFPVAGAGLLFAVDVVAGFLFMALVPPLIPVFVSILLGNVCLMRTALEYALRVSSPLQAAMLPVGQHEQGVARRPLAARAA
jgi:hypothetical protein